MPEIGILKTTVNRALSHALQRRWHTEPWCHRPQPRSARNRRFGGQNMERRDELSSFVPARHDHWGLQALIFASRLRGYIFQWANGSASRRACSVCKSVLKARNASAPLESSAR